jgi:hypothetical protein
MLQKVCECREGEMENWKQNWDEVFMDGVKRETGEKERERREKEREKREEKIKCHEMFRDRKG